MDGGAWWAAVHEVTKSRTRLNNFTFTFHFHALEKEMATHSSVLAWRIPGTGEPAGLPSMGSHRVGHNWSNLATAAAAGDEATSEHEWKRICYNLGFFFSCVQHSLVSLLFPSLLFLSTSVLKPLGKSEEGSIHVRGHGETWCLQLECQAGAG